MKRLIILVAILFSAFLSGTAQTPVLDSIFPVRGLAIAAPAPAHVDDFVTFIDKELAPRHINTLILRVDYTYQYTSHPELRDTITLSKADVKKLVAVCKKHDIRIVPQINLLGHQSWHSHLSKLLEVYPQFDETPEVQLPEEYEWPNEDELYCKSYCPLHPEVHDVVFDLVDELCDVFEADAFHAGMDEVFYLGNPQCPRCQGRDKAALFAGEVWKIRNHLAQSGRELWIWGDRLLDGKTTGLGMWEASYNNTHRAIDMIPKDVFICDWHYERPDKTPVIFAMNGLRVATCPWRHPGVTEQQVKDMASFRESATPQTKNNYAGMIQTVWAPVAAFMQESRNYDDGEKSKGGQWATFITMVETMNAVCGIGNQER